VLLAILGAAAGMAIAKAVISLILALFVSSSVPIVAGVSGTVLTYTVVITLAATVLFGLAPALRAGRTDIVKVLGAARGPRRRIRALGFAEPLVIGQIAFSLVLVVGAGLFARSFFNLESEPLGFDQDNVIAAPINPRLAGITAADAPVFYARLYDRLRALPGTESVTLARYSPLSGGRSLNRATIDGYTPAPGESVTVETVLIGPTYPQTLGMPLVSGRAITAEDRPGAPSVALVNEAFVRRYAPGANPIGHGFSFGDRRYEIVGIVKDAQFQDARTPMTPVAFLAMAQETSQRILDCEIEVRSHAPIEQVTAALRAAVADVDSRVTLSSATTLRRRVVATFQTERLAAQFVAAFAALALFLAAIGLYGIVAYGVARRTNEIGLRLALGASGGVVLWLLMRETLARLGVGLALGSLAALAAGRLVENQLFGVHSSDPVTFGLAAVALVGVAVITTIIPAMHALRIDPVRALRSE